MINYCEIPKEERVMRNSQCAMRNQGVGCRDTSYGLRRKLLASQHVTSISVFPHELKREKRRNVTNWGYKGQSYEQLRLR